MKFTKLEEEIKFNLLMPEDPVSFFADSYEKMLFFYPKQRG